MGGYHFQFSIFNFQFSIKAYGKLQCEGYGMCAESFTRGDKDINMVFEDHVAGLFVRDVVVIF